MKWIASIAIAAALAVSGAASAFAATSTATPSTIVSWPFADPYGSFAESMALGSDGHLYVSRTIWGDTSDVGVIERVSLTGGPVREVARIDAGYGLVAGLAVDPQNRLYVAVASFDDTVPTAVYRVEGSGRLAPVLYLPTGAFPNGLAFYGGSLYVTDPDAGAIWRARLGASPVTLTTPWLTDPALAPGATLGPDGIAFRGSTMYVTQYDRGQILTAVIAADGTPGSLHVLVDDPALVTADGVAFDSVGNLWVTVNDNRLAYVTSAGAVVVAAEGVSWLDYPTQIVFGPRGAFVVNGSFDNGEPSIVALPD